MNYKEALEMNERKNGLDLEEIPLGNLFALIEELPGWDYPLAEEFIAELARRSGIDMARYFAEPEVCNMSGNWTENPLYDEQEPHGTCCDDLVLAASEILGFNA